MCHQRQVAAQNSNYNILLVEQSRALKAKQSTTIAAKIGKHYQYQTGGHSHSNKHHIRHRQIASRHEQIETNTIDQQGRNNTAT